MLRVQTRNTLYKLMDLGDGAFTIEGHSRYCPTPTKCRLREDPTKGHHMVFTPLEGPYRLDPIRTTEIVSISE